MASSKATTFPDQDAFHRCVPSPPRLREASRRACHRAPDFAAGCRLPTPIRLLIFQRLDPRTRVSEREGQAQRIDFCNLHEPMGTTTVRLIRDREIERDERATEAARCRALPRS